METNKIWGMLENIPDPEIPNVSIVEMGIVRGIEYNHDTLNVIITPTYSGCPAIDLIKREIKQNLIMKGINDFEITTSLFPPWTTEWLNEKTKNKLSALIVIQMKLRSLVNLARQHVKHFINAFIALKLLNILNVFDK